MVTAAMVKELRERTGAGMMDCKRALGETAGDMEKAIEYLREKGLAAAAKKAGRIAAEGLVDAFVAADGKVGAMTELNCETDFVANTDEFKDFVRTITEQVVGKNPADLDSLLASGIQEQLVAKIAKIGENMSVRRFARFELNGNGIVESYIHMGGKIGVLVELTTDTDVSANAEAHVLAKDLAMQIAAAKPLYVVREEFPAEIIEKEKEILKAQAVNEGKPDNIAEKMVIGRIEKFYKESCLLEQVFVKDSDLTIQKLLAKKSAEISANFSIKRFARFEMGEGLEKRQDDFAAEVAAQTKKS